MKPVYWKILIVGGLLGVIIWFLFGEERTFSGDVTAARELKVSVVEVHPRNSHLATRVVGITRERWSLDVISSVDGRVQQLPEMTDPGALIQKGQLLVAIDDTAYLAGLKTAEARLARAQLDLAQNRHQKYVATKISKGQKLSAFGRFEPHIKAAEAERNAAQVEIEQAAEKVEDARVVAPFDAVVVSKQVVPGQWVNSGDVLYRLASSAYVDVDVELSSSNWQRLGKLNGSTEIVVEAPDGERWSASVRYINPVLNETTRQRSLVLQVASPFQSDQALLPGQQVTAEFSGSLHQDVVSAPATALNQDGRVWSVRDGILHEENIELLDEQPERILFRFRDTPQMMRQLVVFPLSTMLSGQQVLTAITETKPGAQL